MSMDLKKLVSEYEITDSLTRKNELQEFIEEICRAYVDHRSSIISEYHLENRELCEWPCCDYRTTSGWMSLRYVYGATLTLHYSDTWSRGGRCDEMITLKVDDVVDFTEEAFRRELYTIKFRELECKVVYFTKMLEDVERVKYEFLEKFASA